MTHYIISNIIYIIRYLFSLCRIKDMIKKIFDSFWDVQNINMSQEHFHSEIYKPIYKKIHDNCWQNLKNVDLSNNKIDILPKELGNTLPCLRKLNVSNNLLGLSAHLTWTWLDQPAIRNNLCLLDMSSNYLTELPGQIGNLNALKNLNVCKNMLKRIPQSVGFLQNLVCLNLSDNKLLYLPGSINLLRLRHLNILRNPFSSSVQPDINCIKVPSLFELSARCIIKHRIAYNLLPSPLMKYLNNAKCCCLCGESCFDSYISKFIRMQPAYVALLCQSTHIIRAFSAYKAIPMNGYVCYFCFFTDWYIVWHLCRYRV